MYLNSHRIIFTKCQDTAVPSKCQSVSENFPKQDLVQKEYIFHVIVGGLLVLNRRVRVMVTICQWNRVAVIAYERYADMQPLKLLAAPVITRSSSIKEITHLIVKNGKAYHSCGPHEFKDCVREASI